MNESTTKKPINRAGNIRPIPTPPYKNRDFKPKRTLSKYGRKLLERLIVHPGVNPGALAFSQNRGNFYGHYQQSPYGFTVFQIPLKDWKMLFNNK